MTASLIDHAKAVPTSFRRAKLEQAQTRLNMLQAHINYLKNNA